MSAIEDIVIEPNPAEEMQAVISFANRQMELALIGWRAAYDRFWELEKRPSPQVLQQKLATGGQVRLTKMFVRSFVFGSTLKSFLHEVNEEGDYIGQWQPSDDQRLDTAYEINFANGVWDGDEIVVGPIKSHWNNG